MPVRTDDAANFGNALLRVSIARKLLPRLKNRLRFDAYGIDGTISENDNSKELRFNTMVDLDVSTTALTEGANVTTAIDTITLTGTSTIVREWGRAGSISSLTKMVWTETERNEVADIFAFNGARVLDTLMRNNCYLTTNYFASQQTAINGTVSSGWSSLSGAYVQDIAYLEGALNEADCEGFEDLGGSYALLIHGRAERQMKTDVNTGRLSWANVFAQTETGVERIIQGKVGKVLNTMVLRTNNLTSSVALSANNTAYSNVMLAKYGFGKAKLGDGNVKVIIKTPGPNDTSNALDMFSTIGWKAVWNSLLLDSRRIYRYYTGTGV